MARTHENLTGQQFGRWLVVSFSHFYKGRSVWAIKCSGCGVVKKLRKQKFSSGKCTKCDKTHSMSGTSNPGFVDCLGKRFGRLVVVELMGFKNCLAQWRCVCDCGGEKISGNGSIATGRVKSCGCLRRPVSTYPKGVDHPRWNPDRDEIERNKDRMKDPAYRQWRNAVFKRDDYRCQITGRRGGNLVAHHIEAWGVSPELRFEVSNGITIDWAYHALFHRMFGQGGNTAAQFEQFKFWMKLLDIQPDNCQYPQP